MTTALTATQARNARARAQGLGAERATTVVDAVRRVVGLQAQDVQANRLAVRVRTSGLTRSDVDTAVNDDRSVVRTWAMRGTLHMLAAEDLGWIVGVLGPYFAARLAPRRNRLGLDEPTTERGVNALHAVLAEQSPLTRAELVARIADHGVHLDPRSQAPAHLIGYAAMTGRLCRGPDLDKDEPTYVPTGELETLPEDEALARLASRYLTGYAPASAEDFAAWSGLPLGKARRAFQALAGDLDQVPVETNRREVRLLGHFDTYLLGYRNREYAVPPEFDSRIQSGGGFIMPAVLVDGRVVGTWRQSQTKKNVSPMGDMPKKNVSPMGDIPKKKDGITITVEPFTTIATRLLPKIRTEAADLGRFLSRHTEVTIADTR